MAKLVRTVAAAAQGSAGTPRASAYLLALLSAASIAAIWSILSLISGGFGGYMALPVALALVLLLHAFAFVPGVKRALFATLLMGLSIVYQAYLFAAGLIAGEMGYSLGESLRMTGFELGLAMFRGRTAALELACYGAALLLAFLLGLLLGRKA